MAQSSGLAKVERKNAHEDLSTIPALLPSLVKPQGLPLAFLETGTLDAQGFAAMLKANKGEDVGVAQVNAVLAVARLAGSQGLWTALRLHQLRTGW